MITKILLISAFCCGWRVLISEGMLLHPLAEWFKRLVKGKDLSQHPGLTGTNLGAGYSEEWKKRGEWIYKPLFGCVYCYASFWGTIVYWVLTVFVYQHGVNIQTLAAWPIVCIAAAFTNGFMYGLFSKYEEYIR